MSAAFASRRRLAVALASLAAAAAAAAGGAESGPAAPVTARASVTPREHFFADRLVARVEVTLDVSLVDPDGVRLLPRFTPYRRTGPIEVVRRDLGRMTILSFTAPLQCIDRACLRGAGESRFRLPPAVVQYFLRADPTPVGLQAGWPELTVRHRLRSAGETAPARGRTDELPDISYRIPPAALGFLLAGASAALVLGATGAAALRLRPRAPPPARPPVEDRRALALDSVLALVERARDDDARRVALDMLARSLAGDGQAPLAERAQRLAWSPSPPAADETQSVARAVRRVLEEAQ